MAEILAEDDDFGESDISADGVLGETFGQVMVGHSPKTRPSCGGYRTIVHVCLNVDLHNQVTLDGVSHVGQVWYRRGRDSCHKPECEACYGSWAVGEAVNIEGRLSEASKRFGQVEHFVVSVPEKDLHLGMGVLRCKAEKILLSLGVLGGNVVPHAFRYRPNHWYLGVHFHVLGFVLGGFGRCRHCQKRRERACPFSCDGFQVRAYKEYLRSGWIVKVAHDRFGDVGERRSVWGTAKYELSHATFERGKKRVHIVSWFGVCSYRKLKWTPEKKKEVCGVCGYELKKCVYVGSERLDLMPDSGWADFLDAYGRPQWVLIGEG